MVMLITDFPGTPYVDFTHEGGYLTTSYHPSHLLIADMEVPFNSRRRGIGTALVEAARAFAQEKEIPRVIGGIISRESLEIMEKVFGPDSVVVTARGEFGIPKTTHAFLDHYFVASTL